MVPPSEPKHGCAPAPRHGVPGPPTPCAHTVAAKVVAPNIPSVAVFNADLHRIALSSAAILTSPDPLFGRPTVRVEAQYTSRCAVRGQSFWARRFAIRWISI